MAAGRRACGLMTGLGGLGHTLPYLYKRVLFSDLGLHRCCCSGVSADLLDSASLPASFRHFPGSFGWSPGLYNRYSNRLCLAAVQHPSSNWPIAGKPPVCLHIVRSQAIYGNGRHVFWALPLPPTSGFPDLEAESASGYLLFRLIPTELVYGTTAGQLQMLWA